MPMRGSACPQRSDIFGGRVITSRKAAGGWSARFHKVGTRRHAYARRRFARSPTYLSFKVNLSGPPHGPRRRRHCHENSAINEGLAKHFGSSAGWHYGKKILPERKPFLRRVWSYVVKPAMIPGPPLCLIS